MVDIVTRLGKGSPLTNAEVDANFTNLAEVSGVTGEPMGHEDRTTSTISFNASTRTFTIAPTASSFTVWCKGKKVVVSSARTVTIPNTTGMYSIYFDSTGTLAAKSGYFTFAEEAPTAYIYWNATTGTAPYFGDERHGVVLDWQTHEYLHRTRGAALASGFSASGYVLGGSGSLNSHAQLTLEGGTFFDEDMKIIVTATNTPTAGTWEQDLTSPARIPVLYLSGTAWVIDSPTDYPLKQGTARPQYNAFSGGVWSTADVANNKYATSWILATNNLTYPVIAIIGQAQSDLQSAAEAVDFTELQLPGFPSVEFRPLYKLVFQCADSCTNAVHASLVSITDIRSIAAAGTAASIVSDHGNLTGLSDDDHPQYLSVDTVRGSLTAAVKASFLPSQTSNAGKFLQTDGTATSWQALTSGNVTTALGFTPYNATNPSGYISGITSGMVTTALGFTPYNATNPSGYVNAAGARGAISVTGAGSYDSATGVINIVGGVTSFNTRTGAITLSSSDVTTALGFTPYNSTNPNGYLTGITSTQVTTALGYTPYNSSNPSGYITGITSGMVTTALGFTPYNNSNPSGYITSAALSPYLTTASAASTYLALSGGTMTGIINMAGTQKITTAGYAGIEYYNTAGNWEGYIGTENNTGNLRYNARLGTHTWYANSTSIGAWDASSLRVSGSVLTTTGASSWGVYSNTNGSNYSGIWFSTNVGELLLRTADGSLSTRIAADGSYAFINNNNILHAGNYNSYSPTLTGTGASGTWGISISGNSATTSQRSFSNDISTTGQGRFGGWYSGGAATGAATEVGLAGGEGYILTYNRNTSAYAPLNIAASAANMQFNGNTINVTSGSLQQGGSQVLHAGNYTSYSPSLGGSGASGTWGISISGNAATATSADAIDGVGFRNTGSNSGTNADTIESNGITYYTAGVPNFTGNATDGALYSQAYSGNWQHQIAGDYRSGQIALRGKNSGTWQSWRTVLDASNYTNYAVPQSDVAGSGANKVLKTASNGYLELRNWIDVGSAGIFSSTVNSSHFLPNPDSYGSWKVIGSRNGYNGLEFASLNNGPVSLMVNSSSNLTGFHNNNAGWQFRWEGGVLYCSKNSYGGGTVATVLDSSNYSSYALPLSGGTVAGPVTITGNDNQLIIDATSGPTAGIFLRLNGANKWEIYNSSNAFGLYNYSSGQNELSISAATGVANFRTTPTAGGNAILHAGNINSYIPSWSTGVNASHIVQRDTNGYIYANHINFNTSESENDNVNSFITSNGDGWSRKASLGHVKNSIRGVADGTWGINITGNAGSATTATSSPLVSSLGSYVWSVSTLPTSYPLGIQCSFVYSGWPNYGSVMNMNAYPGGGSALQMYVPYSPTYGGTGLQVRFGNYDVSTGNSWTIWKTLLASDNYTSYAPSTTGTTSATFITAGNATWGGRLQIGGNGGGGTALVAVVQATNGNLHMDAGSGNAMYLNYYNNGVIYLNGGTYQISANGANYNGTAANSSTLGGYGPNQTGGANTIVQRDGNGYIQNNYFYTSGGGSERNGSGLGYFAAYNASDYYIRSYTPAAAAAAMGALTTGNYSSYALPLSGGTLSGDITFSNGRKAIVGVYDPTQTQAVFAMGPSYKLTDGGGSSNYGNFYGLGWSYDPNYGGSGNNPQSKAGLGHQLLLMMAGTTRTALGTGIWTDGVITATSNITAYSDERLKTNWRNMPDNFVARLAQVKVGIYDRIDGNKITQVGVSAQSFQQLLPQAVETAKDEVGTLSVSYGNAALVSAVELAKDNVELRARIERLESLLNKLIGD